MSCNRGFSRASRVAAACRAATVARMPTGHSLLPLADVSDRQRRAGTAGAGGWVQTPRDRDASAFGVAESALPADPQTQSGSSRQHHSSRHALTSVHGPAPPGRPACAGAGHSEPTRDGRRCPARPTAAPARRNARHVAKQPFNLVQKNARLRRHRLWPGNQRAPQPLRDGNHSLPNRERRNDMVCQVRSRLSHPPTGAGRANTAAPTGGGRGHHQAVSLQR